MWRAPRRWAPFTCTSACCSASATTVGSGSVASPRPRARNPRSTAFTATAKGIRSRNASSGTTRISVREHALQAALRLRQRLLEVVQLFAVAEADVVGQPEMLAGHEQHAVLGAYPLDHVERARRLAVFHETDRAGLGRVPAERVPEALQPALEDGVVRLEDAAGAAPPVASPPRRAGPGAEGGPPPPRAAGGVVLPRPPPARGRRRRDDA